LATVACAKHGRTGAQGDECRPVEGRFTTSTPWDSLSGGWQLTLVAGSGSMAGRRVQGAMTLRAQDPALRRVDRPGPTTVTVPVIGTTDIALEQVGAVRMGDVRSTDPLQPGVAIWASQSPDGEVSAVMRIGQEAIRSDIMRIEGGYTALFLRQVSADAIRGGWASGVTSEESSGYFCALRVAS
jgi:uncharacterized Zn-binding protein involved in type VI secretion